MSKLKIFALCHITPPIHGAAVIGDRVVECIESNPDFELKVMNLSSSKSIADFDGQKIKKILKLIVTINRTFTKLYSFQPKVIYFTPSLNGSSLIRDCFIAQIFKIYCKFFDARLICHIHMRPNVNSVIQKKMVTRLLANTEVILLSASLKKDFSGKALAAIKKLYLLSNYITPLLEYNVDVSKQKVEINSPIFTLLYFGHMIESKGCLRLLFILRHYLDNYKVNSKKVMARFVGEFASKDFKRSFLEVIEKLNLTDYVSIEAPIYSLKDKSKIFDEVQLLVLPSYSEAYPLTILEAFSVGTPVMATDTGAVSDLISTGLGVTVKKKQIESSFIALFSLELSKVIADYSKFSKLNIKRYFENNNSKINFELNLEQILWNTMK
jgi:glycosyltransferase involved in cell wall biosynthesis